MATLTAAALPSTFVRCGDLPLRSTQPAGAFPAVAAQIGSVVFGTAEQAPKGAGQKRGTARAAWVAVENAALAPAPVSGPASDTSEWGVEAGDKLGRYQLMRELGRGANGQVWEALDPALDVRVAIKVLAKDSSARGTERLLREARAAARLRHSAIVRATDFGAHEGRPYLVLEHLEGLTLEARVRLRGPLHAVVAVRQMLPLLEALHFAHEAGIVHRDVKPDNIFLTEELGGDGRVSPKLLDFGVAVDTRGSDPRLTAGGALIGTPAFMSPEQATGRRDIDRRADVWAMAVTYYECIAGHEAFPCKDIAELLEKVLNEMPPSFAGLSGADEALFSIFRRALAKDREERWPSARAFGNALARWLVTQGVTEDCNGRSLVSAWAVCEEPSGSHDVANLDTLPVPLRAQSLAELRGSAASFDRISTLSAEISSSSIAIASFERPSAFAATSPGWTAESDSLTPTTSTELPPVVATPSKSRAAIVNRRYYLGGAAMFAAAFTLALAFFPGAGGGNAGASSAPPATVVAADLAAAQPVAPPAAAPEEKVVAMADPAQPVVEVPSTPSPSATPATSAAPPKKAEPKKAPKRTVGWPTPRPRSWF